MEETLSRQELRVLLLKGIGIQTFSIEWLMHTEKVILLERIRFG